MPSSRSLGTAVVASMLLLALSAVSASAGSTGSAELALDVRDEDRACKSVVGANGGDVVCAGLGATVIALRDHPPGAACPSGGRAISWGADANGNRALDPSELEGSTFVCRDARGARSLPHARALVKETPLAHEDGFCPAGGTLVQSGVDRNGDGVLSASEIDRASFACNRLGGPASRASVEVTVEPAGPRCRFGGRRIAIGHEGEASRISYACDVR